MNKQTFSAKIKDGKIEFQDKTGSVIWLELLDGKEVEITIAKEENKRTTRQNNALHKLFDLMSEKCEKEGITVSMIVGALKNGVDICPTPQFLKDLWKTMQEILLKKSSTTDLNKVNEIDLVYEAWCKFWGDRFGIYVEFPNEPNPTYL